MKMASKLLAVLAVIAMLMTALPLSTLAAPVPTSDNLAVNGDFESGDMTGWTTYQGTAADAAAAKEGSYGAHLKGDGGWGTMMCQTIPVEAGKEYYFAFWIKVNATGVNVSVKADNNNGDVICTAYYDTGYSSWKLIEYTFTAPTNAVFINFNGSNAKVAEDMYVDSVQLYCITEEKASFDGYVYNGDFEFGDLDHWDATTVTAKKVAGHDSATGVEVASTKWNSLFQYVTVRTYTDYTITAWAKKAENHSGSYNLLLKNGSTNLKEIQMNVTDEWQKFSFDFNSGSATSLRLMVMANVDNATIVVDDISIKQAAGGEEASALTNGGFESGAEGWTLGKNEVVTTVSDGAQVHEGSAALKTNELDTGALFAEQTVAVTPNTDYVVSLWYYCYTENSSNPAYYFDVNGATPDYAWKNGTFHVRNDNRQYPDALNTWVKAMLKFRSGDSNTVTIRLSNYRKDAGQYYFDEVNLVEYDENDYDDSGYVGNSNKKKAAGTDIRVMSYNVLMDDDEENGGISWGKPLGQLTNGGEGTRDGNAAACIKYYAPDVIGFQEFSYNWYQGIRTALPNYEFVNNVGPESNKEDYMCTALAYNKDTIEVVETQLFKYKDSRWGNQRMRYINMAVMRVKATGETFMVTNTHPDAGKVEGDGRYRPLQLAEFAQQILAWSEEYGLPIVSVGDFNSGYNADEFAAYVETTGMRDSNANASGGTIDHVMINDMVKSLYATTVSDAMVTFASDHLPIFSDLELLDGASYEIESLMNKIKTQGRTQLVDGTLMLDWSVSGIEFTAKCEGDVSVTFDAKRISDFSTLGGVYFTIVVDGVARERDYCRIATTGEITVKLAEALPAGAHTFAIYRQTEHDAGEVGISTISLKGTLQQKPADNDLYIEFIGDSISAGFGNLGNSSTTDSGKPLHQDGTKAYPFLTAQALGADYSNVSWSGIGCKYGYGSVTMQEVYPLQRYKYDKTTLYDFSAREPDVIVLALGTNDNSNQSNAALRKAGMAEMLTLVREKNPNAKIVWIYNMMTGDINSQIEEIVREAGGADAGYYCVRLTRNNSGGGWHPSMEGQQTFADELVAYLKSTVLKPDKKPVSLAVSTTPDKTEYKLGETLDTTGLVLELTYDDGSYEFTSEGYKVRGFQSVTTGTRTITVTYEGFSAQFTVEVVENDPVKNGWVKEDGKWAYYVDDVKVVSQWKKDSVGWCYLDADGFMATNKWIKDSVGWCYVGSNGYCVTNTWKKDSKGWCYLGADGRMVTNKWVKDSVGWCYVGENGYAVTNCWKKDSVGWCYLNASGSMTKNAWINDGSGWYFLDANGYMVTSQWKKDSKGWCYLGKSGKMATNQWIKDSVGWCYVGDNGYCLTNAWVKDSKGWCFLDKNGRMVYSQWILDDGKYYYIDANGYMLANTTATIEGVQYSFGASGAWVK